MMNIILGIGAILILVILFMIFRVGTLISVAKGSHHKRAGTSNKVNAALLMVFLVVGTIAAVWSSYAAADDFLPEPSSVHGEQIDTLFWVTMGILCAVFFATHVLLFYFPFKYQFKEGNRAAFYPDNNKLEVIWTIVPAIVLTLLVLSGWKVWRDITTDAPQEAEVVEIVGQQFNWHVRYPGKVDKELGAYNYKLIDASNAVGIDLADEKSFDDFMAPTGEIRVPVGKPVLLKIRARDVLHSVYMPHFRLKMDAVPGMPTRFWFTPTKTTAQMKQDLNNPDFDYELACTEVCGRGHFSMRLRVIVEEEADYRKWYDSQKSWLSSNREGYLERVPANLREKALQVIGSGDNPSAAIAPLEEPVTVPANPAVVKTSSTSAQ
jgi:cytochrome c oxidase subunit 2